MMDGPEAALGRVADWSTDRRMRDYHLYHAVLADLYRRAGDRAAAAEAYRAAITHSLDPAERRYLERRLAGLRLPAEPDRAHATRARNGATEAGPEHGAAAGPEGAAKRREPERGERRPGRMHHLTAVRPRRTLLTLSVLAVAAQPGGPVSAASRATSRRAAVSPSATRQRAVILQMDVSPGFVPQTVRQLSMPTFTLYADGTAIYRPATGGTYRRAAAAHAGAAHARPDRRPHRRMRTARVASPPPMRSTTTGSSPISPRPPSPSSADDVTKTVSVYALGFPAPEPGPNDAELAALTALAGHPLGLRRAGGGGPRAGGGPLPTDPVPRDRRRPMSADDTSTATAWPIADVDLPVPAEGSQTYRSSSPPTRWRR